MLTKILRQPLLAIALASLVFASCSDDDAETAKLPPAGKIVGKVDGVSFELDGEARLGATHILIQSVPTGHVLEIFVAKAAAVGTYDATGTDGPNPDASVFYRDEQGNMYFSSVTEVGEKVGTVTITEVDKVNQTVSGTFSSKAYTVEGALKEITEGSFSKIRYVDIADNAMTAKVDDAEFTAVQTTAEQAEGKIYVEALANGNASIIILNFNDDITVGPHDIGSLYSEIFAVYLNDDVFLSTGGTLTITKHDTNTRRIEGTFNFDALLDDSSGEQHIITEGVFSLGY
jgi:hypothetical protein